jgi:hypothetical protein
MRSMTGTLTGYLIGVAVVLSLLNGIAWFTGVPPRQHDFGMFSVGFILGAIGMYIAAHLYGYRRVP